MLAVLVWSPTCFESSLSLSLQFIDSAYPANLGTPLSQPPSAGTKSMDLSVWLSTWVLGIQTWALKFP